MPETTTAMLQTRDLEVAIGGHTVCRALGLDVQREQCWAVLGRNGVGKTTLLHSLAGLHAARSGQVLLTGEPMARMNRRRVARRLGLLFQDAFEVFPSTVLETALMGRHPHLRAWEWESDRDEQLARAALDRLGLGDLASRRVNTLSGGERRRLGMATLLTQDPDLYLLDEPTNHLDLHHQITLLNQLQALAQQQHKSVVMTLHDVNLAMRFSTHVLLLFGGGEWLAGPRADMLTAPHLERLYQHPMRTVSDGRYQLFIPA